MTATAHNVYIRNYVNTLLKKLSECLNGTTVQELKLSAAETTCAEYYLKEVSSEPISANTSFLMCGSIFRERLSLLLESDPTEWTILDTLIRDNARHLSPDDIIKKDELKGRIMCVR